MSAQEQTPEQAAHDARMRALEREIDSWSDDAVTRAGNAWQAAQD